MNRYLSSLILALFVLCSSEVSRSQVDTATCIINGENWCDSTVVVPYNVFPLLGFTFGHFGDYDKINQWKKYGLNGIHAPERKGIDLAARFMTNGLYAEERFHDLIDDDAFGDLSYVGHW